MQFLDPKLLQLTFHFPNGDGRQDKHNHIEYAENHQRQEIVHPGIPSPNCKGD